MFREFLVSLAAALSTPVMAQVQLVEYSCNQCSNVRALPVKPFGIPVLVESAIQNISAGLYPYPDQRTQIALLGMPSDSNIGGSGNDIPADAAVDPNGNIWIVGSTDSDDFALVNPIGGQKVPYRSAGFVIELDATGRMVFATYLCGQRPSTKLPFTYPQYRSSASAIAFDSAGNAYVGGSTNEPDFPTTPGAYIQGAAGIQPPPLSTNTIFSYLVKISPAGKLIYATELTTGTSGCEGSGCFEGGGSTSAGVNSVFVDGTGAATVAGPVYGTLYPKGVYEEESVLRLAPDGSKLLWKTNVKYGPPYNYVVTSLSIAPDLSTSAQGVVVFSGNVNLFGTYAPGAYQPYPSGIPSLFAAQLKADGSGYNYFLDLGQSSDAHAAGIVTDPSGIQYVAGTSSAAALIPPAGVPNAGPDFVLMLDSKGSQVRPPLHFPHGAITAPPSLSRSNARGSAANLLLPGAQASLLVVPVDYAFDSPAMLGFANSASLSLNTGIYDGTLLTIFGYGFSSDAQVLIDGQAAPVLSVSSTQINVQVPFGLQRVVRLQVTSSSGTVSTTIGISQSLGIFTTDGIHAAALNADGSVNSRDNPALAGSVVSLFGTGATWPPGTQAGAIATSAMPLSQQLNRFQAFDSTGTPLNIMYSGAAPGLIDGVFQVNVQLLPTPPVIAPVFTVQMSCLAVTCPANPVQIYIK
jgi:uncharacterized protein (TIGR03437 family)